MHLKNLINYFFFNHIDLLFFLRKIYCKFIQGSIIKIKSIHLARKSKDESLYKKRTNCKNVN